MDIQELRLTDEEIITQVEAVIFSGFVVVEVSTSAAFRPMVDAATEKALREVMAWLRGLGNADPPSTPKSWQKSWQWVFFRKANLMAAEELEAMLAAGEGAVGPV